MPSYLCMSSSRTYLYNYYTAYYIDWYILSHITSLILYNTRYLNPCKIYLNIRGYEAMLPIVLNEQWYDEHYLIFLLQETSQNLISPNNNISDVTFVDHKSCTTMFVYMLFKILYIKCILPTRWQSPQCPNRVYHTLQQTRNVYQTPIQ